MAFADFAKTSREHGVRGGQILLFLVAVYAKVFYLIVVRNSHPSIRLVREYPERLACEEYQD
jgi:hypothetical protein